MCQREQERRKLPHFYWNTQYHTHLDKQCLGRFHVLKIKHKEKNKWLSEDTHIMSTNHIHASPPPPPPFLYARVGMQAYTHADKRTHTRTHTHTHTHTHIYTHIHTVSHTNSFLLLFCKPPDIVTQPTWARLIPPSCCMYVATLRLYFPNQATCKRAPFQAESIMHAST